MMSLHRRHKGKRQSLFILFLFVLVLYTEGTEQALAQLTELVSKSSSGVLGNSDTTLMNFGINSSDISSDGRFVAFTSAAKNLVSGDTNNVPDVFVHDRNTKKTTRISVSNAGVQGNSASINPAISPDGRYVAFESGANNLVPGDTNGGLFDLFMYDRVIGKIERISVSSSGAQGNHNSTGGAAVSENGRYVAFTSWATNLVAGDTNGYSDIFVRDRVLGTTTLVSKATNGAIGDDLSRTPKISADGRYIVFTSLARNLEPITYLDPHYDVFVHDRTTGVTVRVNVSSNGNQPGGVDNGDYTGEPASISADGRYVAFAHNAPLDPLDTELATRDVFVRDLVLGKTTLVSLSNSGTPTSWPCWAPSISADGRFVAFLSNANDLVAGDTNGSTDVFVRDRIAGTTTRVSVSSNGAQGNLPSGLNTYVAISAHGNFVAFLSAATNLVVGDTNGFIDLFVHTSCPITAATPTPLPQLQAGPYPVASWDWDFGTVSTTNPNSGLPLTVNHFGRLWYPTNGAGGALPPVATGGPFSLLVFGHGNYTGAPQFGNNHTGFDYLMAHLASWGIVASSVNLDVISLGVDAAISQRGDILLETINKTVALSSQPGVTPPPGLAQAIGSKIGLAGHSRGGEGAVSAYIKNQALSTPHDIKAVATISPTDYESYLLPDVPYLGLYGSQDGDVSQGAPIRLHDRALSGTKLFEYIHGANHFWFTKDITFAGEGDADIPRELHHSIAKGYIGGFLVRFLTSTSTTDPSAFSDGREMAPLTSQVEILPMYRSPDHFMIDDFELNPALTLTSSGLPAVTFLPLGLEQNFQSVIPPNSLGPTFYHETRGLTAVWAQGGPNIYGALLSASSFNSTPWTHLSGKFAQNLQSNLAFNINEPFRAQDVDLGLLDADGDFSTVPLSCFGKIVWPKSHEPSSTFPSKTVLRTTRIPLSAFTQVNPQLDLNKLVFAGWMSTQEGYGELEFDDWEFSK